MSSGDVGDSHLGPPSGWSHNRFRTGYVRRDRAEPRGRGHHAGGRGGGPGSVNRRQTVFGIGLLLFLLILGGLMASTAPSGDGGPQGTRALKRFLQNMGIKVILDGDVPSQGTLLLLHDLRSMQEAKPILNWVRS